MEIFSLIDLSRIRRNVAMLKHRYGAEIMLMVKADAYMHGIFAVSAAVEDEVGAFGVATIDEGKALRRAGLKKEVLVTLSAPDDILPAVEYDLTVSVANIETLNSLIECKRILGKQPKVHLKLNTGMNRFGFDGAQIDDVLSCAAINDIKIEGFYSHLHSADVGQIKSFDHVCGKTEILYPHAIPHLCSSSSANLNTYPLLRVGYSAYEGAMTVLSRVIASRKVKCGECIGYGNYRAEKDCNIAWIFGGYADGISREYPQKILIRGREFGAVGYACMDCFAVDTLDLTAELNEEVILQNAVLTPEITAEYTDTIPYTVYTSRRGRIKRIYFDDKVGNTIKGEGKT